MLEIIGSFEVIGGLFVLIRGVWDLFDPIPDDTPRRHYDGDFGCTGQDMIPYDQMTTEEHDRAAELWHY